MAIAVKKAEFKQALGEQAIATGLMHVGGDKAAGGLRSARMGVRSLTAWKSSISRGTPASRAMASRCSTALVEPLVVATDAIALRNALGVRISSGRIPLRSRLMTTSPHCMATFSFPERARERC